MFWSLVRPDRILPPITRSAAVTTSLEAGELAVGMITCERSRRRLLEFDRLINDWLGRFFGPATCQSPRRAASREAFQSPGGSKNIPRGASGAKTAEPAYRPAWPGLRAMPHDIVAVHLPNSD